MASKTLQGRCIGWDWGQFILAEDLCLPGHVDF